MNKEIQKNQKEIEGIFAKLNIKTSKDRSSTSIPKSPVSLKDIHISGKTQIIPVNTPNYQRLLKVSGSGLQESSNSIIPDADDIRKIIKDKVLTKSKSNELRVIKETSNIDDDNLDEKGNQLLQKLKEEIKETNEGQFVIHSHPEKASHNNNSFTSKEKSLNPLIKLNNIEAKYDNYDMQKIAYQAYKNLSHCHSNAPNFLQRMKFYSIKYQTKNELIELLVQKAKPKIKEKTRVGTFNRLIKDSNRRAEAKNRVELLSNNNRIANEFYETNANVIKEQNKRFSQQKWDKIIERFNENEKKKNEKRKVKYEAQRKEAKEREQREVDEMKKFNKKVSKETIDLISHRLYQQAMNRHYKNKNNNNSQANSTRNLRIETDISIREFSNQKKNNYKYHKKNNSSNYRLNSDVSRETFYPKENNPKRKRMNERYKQKNNNSKKQRKYVPFVSAEKIVEGFFKQNNYLKTYYH